jgi:hypothetical protein
VRTCSAARTLCTSQSADPDLKQFMVRGTFKGFLVNVLMDSGATTSFINSDWCAEHDIPLETLAAKDVLSVRLGNNTLEKISKFTSGEVFMGDNIPYQFRPHAMRLPVDCHIVAGLDFMDDYNTWLHPSSRTVRTVVDGVEHVIATMRVDTDEEGFMQLKTAGCLDTFGAFKTSNKDWDVQSCSAKQFRSYLRAFDNGNLSYTVVETSEERLAAARGEHLASATRADADSAYVDSARLGCDFYHPHLVNGGGVGKPGVNSRERCSEFQLGSVDENVFKVTVQFHPEGHFTVLTGDEEVMEADLKDTNTVTYSEKDTETTCASIFPDTSASRPKAGNMMIHTQGASTGSTNSDPFRTEHSVSKLPVNAVIDKY